MTDTAEHSRGSPPPLERRHCARRKVNDTCYIDLLDGANGGLVLNISETGLSLQSALQVTKEEVSRLRFRLPSSDQWLEASAKLVWVGESGKEVGAQFLELSEGVQSRIKEWVGNRDLPTSPASIRGGRHVPQQTINESSSRKPRVPVVDSAHAVAAPRAVARSKRETVLPLWGLGRVLCLLAVAVALLLGLRYLPQLSELPMVGRSKEARNILVSVTKAVRSLYANAVTRGTGGHPQSQSSRHPLNAVQGGTVPPPSVGRRPVPLASPPKSAEPEFGSMVTQALSPGPTEPVPDAAGFRSQGRVQRHAQRGPQSSNVSYPTRTDTPEPSNNVALVGAPAIGAPPSRVIFERGPVSASSLVAISERRSILVIGSFDPTEELQLGKLASHVEPAYPVAALTREIQGTVRVRAFIGRSGEVLRVQLISGPAALAPAAMNAIRKWRYDPTLLNGHAIKSRADVTVYFRLH